MCVCLKKASRWAAVGLWQWCYQGSRHLLAFSTWQLSDTAHIGLPLLHCKVQGGFNTPETEWTKLTPSQTKHEKSTSSSSPCLSSWPKLRITSSFCIYQICTGLAWFLEPETYLIFVIFSPRALFLVKFFSTQKRVNRKKPSLRQNSVNRRRKKSTKTV